MSEKKNSGKVIAVCVSDRKGVKKNPVESIMLVEDFGVEGDAHGQTGIIRQVSLLAQESVDKMIALGLDVGPGAFAENITTVGIDLPNLPVGSMLKIGEAAGRVSQIGKECHDRCNIYKTVGDCIMPREGIFVQVTKPGRVAPGDEIIVIGEAE